MQLQIFYILLSALIGGIWVAGTILAVKRFGSGIAGLFLAIPAESAASYLFIAFNQSPADASRAAYAYPIGLGIAFLFFLGYATWAKRGFRIALSAAIITTLVLVAVEASVNLAQLIPPTLFVISIFLVVFYIVEFRLKIPYISGVPVEPSRKETLRQAALAATTVGTAVMLSQLAGPLLGGVAAAFPGTASIALYSTYKSGASSAEGIRLSRALTKPVLISLVITAYPYSLAVALTYATLGLLTAIAVAFGVAAIGAGVAYRLIRKANYCTCVLSATPCPDYLEHRHIKTVEEYQEATNQRRRK